MHDAAMRAERSGALPVERKGISIDSRTSVCDAFFAIKGENRDGHDFVDSALTLVSRCRARRIVFRRCAAIDAPDVLEALRGMARAGRAY